MAVVMRLPAFAACLATFLVARPLAVALSHNEETASIAAQPNSDVLLEIGTHRHLQALAANMTVEAALADPPSMPAELQAFVSQQLSSGGQAFLQAHSSKAKMLAKFASLSSVNLASMDADKSRIVLNKMALDTMNKIDLQRAECMKQQATQKQLLDETGQDVSSFNAQGTTARAQVMGTQTSIQRLQQAVPQLQQELALHEAKCKESTTALKRQIQLVKQDEGTLKDLSGTTGCASFFLQTGLVRCHNPHAKGVKKKSFIAFKHSVLRHKASQLKSPTTRRALQSALAEVFLQTGHRRHHRSHHSHRHARARHHKRRHHRQHRQHRRHPHHGHKHVALLSKHVKTHSAKSLGLVGKANATRPKATRCTSRSNPDCSTVSDKMMLMQAGVNDEVDARHAELASTESDCKITKDNLQDQIKSAALRLGEQQEMLAETTTIVIDAAEQSRLKGSQYDHLNAENTKMISYCHDSLTQAASELCKIKSIRQELFKIKGERPFIQDCEVSAWTPQACSKKCAGGVQVLERQVIVPNAMGATCPPLAMTQSCNTQDCPVDCSMGEWSGWTSCSAKCGGGIRQRLRHVKQRAEHGGKACSAETESEGCGMAACDKDCELATWGPWSTCSKACGSGFNERVRRTTAPSSGLGACPAEDSGDRLQYKRCNTEKCKAKEATGILKCASKVDVVIMLDGSGSLGQAGFDTMKKAGSALVKAFDPNANGGNGAQVAVLMYSGPKNMANYKKCTGAQGAEKVDLAVDCNMVWVSHFTTSVEAVAGNVENLYWKKGSTMTSAALGTAEAELVYGRADAKQVVIAIADRLPMMPRRTGEAAASLRKKARLIWATATNSADVQKFASWASRPAADNVVYMDAIEELAKPETLNKIIADACQKVE